LASIDWETEVLCGEEEGMWSCVASYGLAPGRMRMLEGQLVSDIRLGHLLETNPSSTYRNHLIRLFGSTEGELFRERSARRYEK
jgi:hypothetical protein